jgi:hypothetical protein
MLAAASPTDDVDVLFRKIGKSKRELRVCQALRIASGHTATNAPDLFRTPKLTVAGPGQYWGGGPPGKPFGCCWLFMFYGWSVLVWWSGEKVNAGVLR